MVALTGCGCDARIGCVKRHSKRNRLTINETSCATATVRRFVLISRKIGEKYVSCLSDESN
jgi:hypothetical protein